jgi:hypothetical protein
VQIKKIFLCPADGAIGRYNLKLWYLEGGPLGIGDTQLKEHWNNFIVFHCSTFIYVYKEIVEVEEELEREVNLIEV